jgi:hypothetical protein
MREPQGERKDREKHLVALILYKRFSRDFSPPGINKIEQVKFSLRGKEIISAFQAMTTIDAC